MEQRVEQIEGGLQCDNLGCNWKDTNIKVSEYEDYLNAPCPKCGENILTEEDYFNAMKFISIVEFVNSLSDKELEDMKNSPEFKDMDMSEFGVRDVGDEDEVIVHVDLHKGIKINKIEKVKKNGGV